MSTATAEMNPIVWNSTEERALKLLGSGCGPEIVATAIGVTVGRISQLLSTPEFAAAVSELRFQHLQKHNEMDNAYDSMEEQLLTQLKDILPLMMRPMEILKAIQVINAAKRRGQSAPESITNQNTVVNLTMPAIIMQQFTTNINNQVVRAGNQTLETIQSSSMLNAAKVRAGERNVQQLATPYKSISPEELAAASSNSGSSSGSNSNGS